MEDKILPSIKLMLHSYSNFKDYDCSKLKRCPVFVSCDNLVS